MHRKPMGGTNKYGKHNIAQSGKVKGMRGATSITEMHPKRLHPNKIKPTEGTKHDKT